MKRKLTFYLIISVLVILDSVLITSPNLLGKIGLFIYKYHYLRTFPRALVTVSLVVFITIIISELLHLLVRRQAMKRITGVVILTMLIVLSVALLIKTGLDFSTWTYGHTGTRFRYGAYLLPAILITVFGFGLLTLPKLSEPWPESSSMKDSTSE